MGLDMKVLMLSTKANGKCGIGVYTENLVGELKKNVDVTSAFIDPLNVNPFYFLRTAVTGAKGYDVVHVQFDYPFFGRLWRITGIYIPIFFTALHLLSLISHFKVVTTLHEIWEPGNPPRFGKLGVLYATLVNEFVFSFSDSLVVLSESAGDRLAEQGVPNSKIILVHHGSNMPTFIDKIECKKIIGLNGKIKIITLLGHIKKSKGHDLLIKVARYLSRDTIVLIAGDAYGDEDRRYLEELKRDAFERIVFHGFVEDNEMPVILNATDIMVLPYRETTQSGILNLSLAYGIPSVASDLPYFKEICRKYGCILLFKSEDATSLLDHINRLLSDTKLQDRLRKCCRKYRIDNTFGNAAKKTASLYYNLTRNPRK